MIKRLRSAGTAGLVVIAVAGHLSIHGIDAAGGPTSAVRHHSPEGASSSHRVLGLCLFVVGLAGTGLTSRLLARRKPSPAFRTDWVPVRFVPTPPSVTTVCSRRIELCVLRV